jgi:uncharacterized protein
MPSKSLLAVSRFIRFDANDGSQRSFGLGCFTAAMTGVVVAVSSLIAASVQATTGLGFALILTPVLFALLNPEGAIVAVTAFGLALNLLVLLAEHRRPSVAWSEVIPILIAVVPGAICGVLILRALSKPVLQVGVGCAVVAAAAMLASGRIRPRIESSWPRLVIGFTTGTLSTSTGISGPPLALWLGSRGMRPGAIRDSITAIFLGTGMIAALTLLPIIHRAHLGAAIVLGGIAAVVAGHAIGSRLFKRLNPRRFERLLLVIIAATGAASVIVGATAL